MMTGTLSTMDPVMMAKRHQKVIGAIKSRDHERINHVMMEHIETGSKPVLESLDIDNQEE